MLELALNGAIPAAAPHPLTVALLVAAAAYAEALVAVADGQAERAMLDAAELARAAMDAAALAWVGESWPDVDNQFVPKHARTVLRAAGVARQVDESNRRHAEGLLTSALLAWSNADYPGLEA